MAYFVVPRQHILLLFMGKQLQKSHNLAARRLHQLFGGAKNYMSEEVIICSKGFNP